MIFSGAFGANWFRSEMPLVALKTQHQRGGGGGLDPPPHKKSPAQKQACQAHSASCSCMLPVACPMPCQPILLMWQGASENPKTTALLDVLRQLQELRGVSVGGATCMSICVMYMMYERLGDWDSGPPLQ